MERYLLKNLKDTEELGFKLAKELKAGDVIAFYADLGAGKTTLTKYIAQGLGVTETVSSPTFTIVQEYESGRLPLYHFDVYRVHSEEELFELDFDGYLNGGGVCVIEWTELIEDYLRELKPEGVITIKLFYGEKENERICEIIR